MRRLLPAALLLVALAPAVTSGGGEPKKTYPDPSPRADKILTRFVAEFVPITIGRDGFPASFRMGSAGGPAAERPARAVTFRRPFAVNKYEVTQELYHVVTGGNPSRWVGPRNSVEEVTWDEAVTFCKKATAELRERKIIAADEEVRLPSEAEWEYCCRAGTGTAYSFGDDPQELTHYAWYSDNSKGHDPPVGAKKPNPWGLYDMHGYVWEWCADDWAPGYEGAPADGSPRTVAGAQEKVLRGGSWAHPPEMHRSAYRRHAPAAAKDDKIGFRCVLAKVTPQGGQGR